VSRKFERLLNNYQKGKMMQFDNARVAYLCSDDVVDLCERVDEYLSDTSWRVLTIDRTPDAQFYAFLTRHRED